MSGWVLSAREEVESIEQKRKGMDMAAGDFSGAGFLVGGLLAGESNRAAELDSAKERAADFRFANLELQQRIDELQQACSNMFGFHVRLKADYEGMRAVICVLMSAIEVLDRDSTMLLATNRDTIAGEASRLSDEKNRESMFSLQFSRRAGMMAVIEACTNELGRLSPQHKFLNFEERFACYWEAYQEEANKRTGSFNKVVQWGQSRENTDRALLQENSEYFGQVAAWAKLEAAKKAES